MAVIRHPLFAFGKKQFSGSNLHFTMSAKSLEGFRILDSAKLADIEN
jgi:hypothetical protein